MAWNPGLDMQPLMSEQTSKSPKEIAKEIEIMIVTGKFKPGQKLKEIALAAQFDISRGPIREALRLLTAKTLVRYIPQKGVVVAEYSDDELLEIGLLHAGTLGVSVYLAARRASKEQLGKISGIAEKLQYLSDEKTSDIDAAIDILFELIAEINRISKSYWTTRLQVDLYSGFPHYIYFTPLQQEHGLEQAFVNWRDVTRAMEQRQATAAQTKVITMLKMTIRQALSVKEAARNKAVSTTPARERI